ncbi:transketolase [Streptomyces sp. NPDC058045]|uniref:transketolase n=1 Tax=Streptomyces sp. NPDC058045 TaxID=3346311 RepID=UPI0036E78A26
MTAHPSSPPVADRAGWTELDVRAVDTARLLAADAVQRVGNGHPGTAMSLAPVAHLLFQQVMRHDPADPGWLGRDRFVLSCGHSSLTLYCQLFLTGYELGLDDLKALRTQGSLTPAHPEYGHTPGVEMTTGPLGQGLASAVGMAMAARRERGLLDPEAAPGESVFDHQVYVLASDGDLMEGVTAEASSLAGHQRLGNLVVIYDDNKISIEDDTAVTFTEDVAQRYAAYGWQVIEVDWRTGPDGYTEDVDALLTAIETARADTGRPSLITVNTVIGWPAPTLRDSAKTHGNALGAAEVAATKELLGFDPEGTFTVEDEVLAHTRQAAERGWRTRERWEKKYAAWRSAQPERAALLDRLRDRRLPDGVAEALPVFAPGTAIPTRKASGAVLDSLSGLLPELWGGSADLGESNLTTMKGEPSFLPADGRTGAWQGGPYGRTLHFGVREHAMGAILNGIALHGLTRPYAGTFLVFSDYMRPAVRLAALMGLPVTYVWTHDSIGLGEDGPTHQPIEHLASLRVIPGLDVVRPADANETAIAWRTVLVRTDRPAGLVLSRQPLPVYDRTRGGSAEGTARGGYVLAEAEGGPAAVLLIATGSEVAVAMDARALLQDGGIPTRVVSMPCLEWFAEQPRAYREEVLPPSVTARVSVEAGVGTGWREIVGPAGAIVSIDHYGASADAATLFEEFGFTGEAVAATARRLLAGEG